MIQGQAPNSSLVLAAERGGTQIVDMFDLSIICIF